VLQLEGSSLSVDGAKMPYSDQVSKSRRALHSHPNAVDLEQARIIP